MYEHLTHRQVLKDYVFNGGIGESGNNKDETRDHSDLLCVDIFNIQVVEVIRIWVRLKGGLAQVFGEYGAMQESIYFRITVVEDRSEGIEVTGCSTIHGTKHCKEGK